ncbi:cache domain-containing sensor histidine kinase [Paenibacillus nasutitermitis]|uniref:histidine kinase n=1 Tax=Paenibacillus nasutitermitis TaxID=1652958 RepID=A0A916ZEC5_9BACL|nr:sensor histidine kinase [Paenibacillus nasutitermitis]GGD91633.1 sensor histidine kinase YesM [Paenibacillus nasutitermitis]
MDLLHRIVRISRKSRIQVRLIVTFLLLSILPLGLTGVLSYTKFNEAISAKTSTFVSDILRLLTSNIRTEVTKYENLADQIMLNVNIQDALQNYDQLNDMKIRELHWYMENTVLQDKFWLFATIKTLQIQTGDDQVLYDYGYGELKNGEIPRLLDVAKRNIKADTWTVAMTANGENTLMLIRRIPAINGTGGPLGYLFVGIDENLFSQIIFGSVDMGEGSDQVIVNGSGTLLSSKNHLFPTGDGISPEDPLLKWIEPPKVTGTVSTETGLYFAVYSHNEELDWKIIGLVPYDYLNTESKDIQKEILWIVLLCILFAFLFTMFISASVSMPLKKLISGMNQVMNGKLHAKISDDGQDEIGYLSDKFNNMTQELSMQIDKVNVEQAKKREVELQMLQAQINPHFLFNTLNSLKWTALLSQADSVSNGLGALAELLRSTIIQKDERISLRNELGNLSNYLIIQQVRYGTSLKMEYVVPEDLLHSQVLKFMLQPLVENAIIHGFEGLDREPRIVIAAERYGNTLKIILQDNGKGIPEDKLNRLLESDGNPNKDRLANIGVGNVRERIKLHFGESYGLEITSEINQGTTIFITIPFIMPIGEDNHDTGVGR